MKLDNINVVENYNLNNILTMKSGGVAKYYYEYNGDESELRRIMDFTKDNNLKYYILGWGSNTIFLNDFDGIIIRNNYKNINILSKMDDKIKIKVGGGEAWDDFVLWSLNNNYFGLENLSHIPGSVGASPVQNIGGYGVEVGQYIQSVRVMDMNNGEITEIKKADCLFSYRESIFKKKKSYFILDIIFELNNKWNPVLTYVDLLNKTFENAMRLRDYIIKIRNEKIPLPSVIPNCGSFYKNIIVDKNTLDKVLIKYPEMIYFNFNYNGENKYKLGTGYIIDKILGMKGYRDGDVGTNTMNSLQIVNYNKEENKLMGREILLLANYIRDKIKEKIDNKLEIEIEVNMVE